MMNFNPMNNMMINQNSGPCLCCAMRFNPGWVAANYPEYYKEHSGFDPKMMMNMPNMMNMGMNPMVMTSGMNPMVNKEMNPNMMNMGMNPMVNKEMNPNMMNMGMNPMMMNPLMNQIQNNSQNSKKDSNENNQVINVIFKKGDGQNTVQCVLSDHVSNIIQKYANKSLDNNMTEKFVFNGKALDPNITIAEAGLYDQANILVFNTKDIEDA